MITIEDIKKADERDFGDFNINKVFTIGMIDKWYNRDICSSFKNFDERSLELAKEERILDIPELKPTKVDDESVKGFYKELSRNSDVGEKFDKVWLGLTMSYFRDDLGVSDSFTNKNNAFYCGRDVYGLKKASGRAPAFSDRANNIIAAFSEKADSQEITDDFKEAVAVELVSPLTARSLNILYKNNSENKRILFGNPLSWAGKFIEDYKIAKPPIYDSLKGVSDFLG